jgi:hypothetical protein
MQKEIRSVKIPTTEYKGAKAMDTSHLESQERQSFEFYRGFMGFMRNSAILIAVILLLMAYFLL